MKQILIIIAVVVAVGVFAAYRMQKTSVVPTPALTTINQSPSQTPTPTILPKPSVQITAGTSDDDLTKDSLDVATKMKAINTDASNIDEGLNDQQGNLSEQ